MASTSIHCARYVYVFDQGQVIARTHTHHTGPMCTYLFGVYIFLKQHTDFNETWAAVFIESIKLNKKTATAPNKFLFFSSDKEERKKYLSIECVTLFIIFAHNVFILFFLVEKLKEKGT